MAFSVCVFCSASPDLDPDFQDGAVGLGRLLAKDGHQVIYGGSRSGLMGMVADGAVDEGGTVIGVIPDFLTSREIAHTGLADLHVVKTMHERQMKMSDLSDIFVVLPGGLGTLAEFFEVITWKTLGVYKKRVIVVNLKGYWDPMLEMIEKAQKLGFLQQNWDTLYEVVGTIDGVPGILDQMASDN